MSPEVLPQILPEIVSALALYLSWALIAIPTRLLLPRSLKPGLRWVLAMIFAPVLAAQTLHLWLYCFDGRGLVGWVTILPALSLLAGWLASGASIQWRAKLKFSISKIALSFLCMLLSDRAFYF